VNNPTIVKTIPPNANTCTVTTQLSQPQQQERSSLNVPNSTEEVMLTQATIDNIINCFLSLPTTTTTTAPTVTLPDTVMPDVFNVDLNVNDNTNSNKDNNEEASMEQIAMIVQQLEDNNTAFLSINVNNSENVSQQQESFSNDSESEEESEWYMGLFA